MLLLGVTKKMSNQILNVPSDFETKIWRGPNDPYLFGTMSIGEAIFEFLSDNPDHMVQIADDSSEMFIAERMKSVAICIAQNLYEKKLRPGHSVLLVLKNHPLDSPLLIACAFLDAVICVVPHGLNIEKYRRILSEVKPKMVLVTEKSLGKQLLSASVVANVPTKFYILENDLATCNDLSELIYQDSPNEIDFHIRKCNDPDIDVAMILVSCHNHNPFSNGSGITLVNVTHKMIMRDIKKDDLFSKTVISTSDFSHPMEVIGGLKSFMTPVTRIILTTNAFRPVVLLQSVKENNVSQLIMDLTEPNGILFYEYLRNMEFVIRGLDRVIMCGKEIDVELTHIKTSFPESKISFEYIVDEFGGSVFRQLINDNTSCSTIGMLTNHFKAKLIGEKGKVNNKQEFDIGELVVGSNVWIPGLYNSPVKNEKNFTADRFFFTGLLGSFDKTGQFRFVESVKRSPTTSRYSK